MDPGPFKRLQSCMAKSSSNLEERFNGLKDVYGIANIGSGKVLIVVVFLLITKAV